MCIDLVRYNSSSLTRSGGWPRHGNTLVKFRDTDMQSPFFLGWRSLAKSPPLARHTQKEEILRDQKWTALLTTFHFPWFFLGSWTLGPVFRPAWAPLPTHSPACQPFPFLPPLPPSTFQIHIRQKIPRIPSLAGFPPIFTSFALLLPSAPTTPILILFHVDCLFSSPSLSSLPKAKYLSLERLVIVRLVADH